MPLQDAILLVGPTGVGKSPLGACLERHGLGGRACHHFDFGAHLRATAAGPAPDFTAAEVALIRDVLAGGALLENESFALALRLLTGFVARRHVAAGDLLVMNGLPRHAGQAAALAPHLRWRGIVSLSAPAAVLATRLRQDVAGDRAGRTDDGPELLARKLAVFAARTAPLLAGFRAAGVPVHELAVTATTRARHLRAVLERLRLAC